MIEISERENGTRRVVILFSADHEPDRSRVKEEFAKASDINNIMKKYRKTGILGNVNSKVPSFGDFASGSDFAEQMRKVAGIEETFDMLPGEIRKKFGHDVSVMMDWLLDPANEREAIDLGLKSKPAVVKPAVVPDPASSGSGEKADSGSAVATPSTTINT